jgi:hypothetical protein
VADIKPYVWQEHGDFSGGLNLQDSPNEIRENQVRQALNIMLDKKGALKKRKGYEKDLGGSSAPSLLNPDGGKPRFCWPSPTLMTPDIIKIDPTGGGHPYHTAGAHYKKMIHSDADNLTFVLHDENFNVTTAVVSIINHNLDKTDANFITALHKNNVTGWPTEYTSASTFHEDMEYNATDHALAIALESVAVTVDAVTTYYGPGLFIIDLDPDSATYMTGHMVRAADNYQKGRRATTKFVRYHNRKWWTWTLAHTYAGYLDEQKIWQLGYFDADTELFTFCFQYGWAPGTGDLRPDGGTWATALQYPTQPRWNYTETTSGPVTGTTAGYLGDTTWGLDNVVTFEVIPEDGGMIIMGTTPNGTSEKFGMEPMIYRLSIPLILREIDESQRLIDTVTNSVVATVHTPAPIYRCDANYATASFPSGTVALTNFNGGGFSYVRVTQDKGTAFSSMFLEGDYGTVRNTSIQATSGTAYPSYANSSVFSFGATLSAKIAWPEMRYGDGSAAFTVTFTSKLYKLIPGLVEVIGIHSDPEVVITTDTDRPLKEAGTYPSPVTVPINVGSMAYAAVGPKFQLKQATYSYTYSSFVISLYDATTTESGVYFYKHVAVPESRLFGLTVTDVCSYQQTYGGWKTMALLRISDDKFLAGMTLYPGGGYCYAQYILLGDKFYPAFDPGAFTASYSACVPNYMVFDSTTLMYGFCATTGAQDQIWIYDFSGQAQVCDTNTQLWESIPYQYNVGLGETVVGVENVFRYYNPTQTFTIVAAITEGRIWLYYEDAQEYKSVNFYTQTSPTTYAWWAFEGFDVTKPVEFCCYRDCLFVFNGETFAYITIIGGVPSCMEVVLKSGVGYNSDVVPDYMVLSDDKLFAHDPRYPDQIFFSEEYGWATAPNTDLAFKTLENFYIPERNSCDGGVVGFISSADLDEMIFGRNKDTYYLSGVDILDYQLNKISSMGGFVSPRGFCETEDGALIFVAVDQIYEFSARSGLTPIGDEIMPRIQGVDMTDCCAAYDAINKCVRIGYSGGELIWNVARRIWDKQPLRAWTESTMGFSCACRYTSPEDKNKLIFGRRDEPYVYVANTGTTDNGEDIRFLMETRTDDSGEFTTHKLYRSAKVLAQVEKYAAFLISLIINHGEQQQSETIGIPMGNLYGELMYGRDTWGGAAIRAGEKVFSDKGIDGNSYSIKIDDTSDKDLTIFKLGVEMTGHLRRREA